MTLELLLCTFESGITQVGNVLLPERPGVCYLISFQYQDTAWRERIPVELTRRTDVRLLLWQEHGLSRNRNHALQAAEGDVCLLADDDCRYTAEALERIRTVFQENPTLDIACFQTTGYDGELLGTYPAAPFAYADRPHGYFVRSCEMAMRRTSRLPRFDERFGIGAPFLGCGEEEVFLHQAVARGCTMRYFPHVVVRTHAGTTGTRFARDARVRRAKGAVLCVIHGPWGAWLRCLKFTLCHVRGVSRWRAFWDMCQGIRYIRRV